MKDCRRRLVDMQRRCYCFVEVLKTARQHKTARQQDSKRAREQDSKTARQQYILFVSYSVSCLLFQSKTARQHNTAQHSTRQHKTAQDSTRQQESKTARQQDRNTYPLFHTVFHTQHIETKRRNLRSVGGFFADELSMDFY